MRLRRRNRSQVWVGNEPLHLVTVSDRRTASPASVLRWLVVPLLVAATAGGWIIGRRTAPMKEFIVTVTLPATTARATTTAAPAPPTAAVVPASKVAPTTTTPPVTTAPVTTPAPAATTAVTTPPVMAPAPAATTAAATPVPIPAGPVIPTAAQFADGKLVLKGSVPSATIKAAIAARAIALLGADHVTDEVVLDPRATASGGGPILVGELVRFAAGSLAVPTEAQPMLDAVGVLMANAPNALAVVTSYTDDQGDPLRNVGLSGQRIDAIAAQWTAKGVRPEQIIRDARGGADPIGDNATEEGRTQNRRVAITLYGLLG